MKKTTARKFGEGSESASCRRRPFSILAFSLSALLSFGAFTNAAFAETWSDGTYTWSYRLVNDTVEIYNSGDPAIDPKPTGDVTIPSSINGRPVTRIGARAFYDCDELRDVEVPNGVTSFGDEVFSGCYAIGVVYLPKRFAGLVDEYSAIFLGAGGLGDLRVAFRENVGGIDWTFTVSGGEATVGVPGIYVRSAIPSGTAGRIAVPGTLGGCPVTGVGNYAFYNCTALTGVALPAYANKFGNAFIGCTSLKSAVIPFDILTVKEQTFDGCTSLESVTIPSTVASIEANAFRSCPLTTVHVEEGQSASVEAKLAASGYTGTPEMKEDIVIQSEEVEDEDSGAVITWKFRVIDGCAELFNMYSPAIPSDTTGYVTIPATLGGCPVTRIGEAAFRSCASLEHVVIPATVTSIGADAFANCSSLWLYDDNIPAGVTSIGPGAFLGCDSMADYSGFVIIRDVLRYYAGSDTEVEIPDFVTRIGDRAFRYNSAITKVTVPSSVKVIEARAFDSCDGLTDLSLGGGVTYIGDSAFVACSALTRVDLPPSVRSVGQQAFEFCYALEDVAFPSCLSSIGPGMFYGCSSLARVHVEDRVGENDRVYAMIDAASTGVSASSLSYPTDLQSMFAITFEANNGDPAKTVTIRSGAMLGGLLPQPVFGDRALDGWYTADYELVTSTTIPHENATYYAEWLDEGYGKWMDAGAIEWTYRIADGEAEIYNDDNNAIPSDTAGAIEVPATLGGCPVTRIGSYAFDACGALTEVRLPDGVREIGECAFYDCTSLTAMTLPERVESIDEEAFENCSSMQSLALNDGLEEIGDNAFYRCSALESVTIPGTVVSIGDYAFEECGALASATLEEGVTVLGGHMFEDCVSLATVSLPDSLDEIGYAAFLGCSSLKQVDVPDGVTVIRERAFAACESLERVSLPSALSNIKGFTFQNCSSLAGIVIPSGVDEIGDFAFARCASLLEVTIPGSVAAVGYAAFAECTSLSSVVMEYGVETIGIEAFNDCAALTTAYIPGSVTYIGDNAFYGTALATVYVSKDDTERVKKMLEDSFHDTSGMTFVELEHELFTDEDGVQWCYRVIDGEAEIYNDGRHPAIPNTTSGVVEVPLELGGCPVTRIGAHAFYKCASLEEVVLHHDVESIGKRAFWGCKGMADSDGFVVVREILFYYAGADAEALVVPEGVTVIGSGAFYGRDTLEDVTIHANVEEIGTDAFDGTALATVRVDKDDTDRVKGMLEDSGYDTSGVTFIEPGDEPGGDPDPEAGTWYTNKAEAVAAALKTGKKIFLVCGRDTCYNTMTTKNVSCEDPSVKPVLTSKCVLWYSNCDTQPEENWYYMYGLGEFTLPLVCIIDPNNPGSFVKRTTGAEYGGPLGPADILAFIADLPVPVRPDSGEGGSGGSGGEGGSGGSGGEATVCGVEFLDAEKDITEAYSVAKAMTVSGGIYDGCDVIGIVTLKLGKVNVNKGTSKVSGSVIWLDGKKATIKGVPVPGVDGKSPVSVHLQVKGGGTMSLKIGGGVFAGWLGEYRVQSANVGAAWGKSDVTVSVAADGLSAFPGTVLEDLLPKSVDATAGAKWAFNKATAVKWGKPKPGATVLLSDPASGKALTVDMSAGRTNLSGMKLTYAPKKGTFKGSFKVYALQGSAGAMKLKKFTFKVTGVVVDGKGYGMATCRNPAVSWPVSVH